LDCKYEKVIYEQMKKECEHRCIKDVGYIRKVVRVSNVMKDEIMKMTPSISMKLQIEVETYLPKIGDVLHLKVEFVFTHGIFFNFNSLKILIPIYNCPLYELKQETNNTSQQTMYLKRETDSHEIRKDQRILILLTNIRFEKDNYSCLGKLLS